LDEQGRIRVEMPAINYLLCKKVSDAAPASSVPDSRAPGLLRAEISLRSPWPASFSPEQTFRADFLVRNAGDTLWLGGRYLRRGAVMLGVKILDGSGQILDEFHGEPPLPRALAPNESCLVVVERACPSAPGSYTLKIDLVDQHVCWFEERGSQTLSLPMEVR
jgi:hypothetical protein